MLKLANENLLGNELITTPLPSHVSINKILSNCNGKNSNLIVENTGIYHLNYAIRVNITSNKAHPRQVS
jgi:hypothetical protein